MREATSVYNARYRSLHKAEWKARLERTKDARHARLRERVSELRAVVTEIKREAGCAICGEDDPIVLIFHHRDKADKIGNVGQMVNNGNSLARILAEVAKCDVLCSNCHARIDYGGLRKGF